MAKRRNTAKKVGTQNKPKVGTTDEMFDLCTFYDKNGVEIKMPNFAAGEKAPVRPEDELADEEGELTFEEFQRAFANPEDVEIQDLGTASGTLYQT